MNCRVFGRLRNENERNETRQRQKHKKSGKSILIHSLRLDCVRADVERNKNDERNNLGETSACNFASYLVRHCCSFVQHCINCFRCSNSILSLSLIHSFKFFSSCGAVCAFAAAAAVAIVFFLFNILARRRNCASRTPLPCANSIAFVFVFFSAPTFAHTQQLVLL